MFNVLLDALPEAWNGYPIDTDFRIGIQISQCLCDDQLSKREKIATACSLLFPDTMPEYQDAMDALVWYLNECDHDNHEEKKGDKVKLFDFDNDQWRIYAAFLRQYKIDLNTADMHWFTFLGLISNLEECSFTRIIEIRQKPLSSCVSADERKRLREVKKVYALSYSDHGDREQEERSMEAQKEFMKILGKS